MTTHHATAARARFEACISDLVTLIGDRPMSMELVGHLDAVAPPGGPLFDELDELCSAGIAEGWLCDRGGEGIRYGRVLRADHSSTGGFSVDVVEMDSVAGPFHRHPGGEVDMVLPRDTSATFDGHGRGWCVYPPESAHYPTVDGGKAVVLYLLPEGEIDFTATPPEQS